MQRKMVVLAAALLAIVSACSSDDGGEEGSDGSSAEGSVVVYATSTVQRAMPELETAFEAENPGIDLQVEHDAGPKLVERIEGGEEPGVLIDASSRVDPLAKSNDLSPRLFGIVTTDIVVPKGNPAGVRDVSVFGDSPVRTVLCEEGTQCGLAAKAVLDKAGVTPVPDQTFAGWNEVAESVAAGQFDATILQSTEWITKIQRVEVVALPANQVREAKYLIVAVDGETASDTFVDWVAESEAATSILRSRGLRPLGGGEASEAEQSGGTP